MINKLPDLYFPDTSIQLEHDDKYNFRKTEFIVSNVVGFKPKFVYIHVPYKSPSQGVVALEPVIEKITNTLVRMAVQLPGFLGEQICEVINTDFEKSVCLDLGVYALSENIVRKVTDTSIDSSSKTYISYEWNPNTHITDLMFVIEAIRVYTRSILNVAEQYNVEDTVNGKYCYYQTN